MAGQSGVGKSSLLNAVDPGLHLRVRAVSAENQKGRHTTTTARLFPLASGGYVVDTPGVRQFQLWDIMAEEVAGYFPRSPALCQPLPLSRLHAHPRGPLRRERRRRRRLHRCPPLRKLLRAVRGRRRMTARLRILNARHPFGRARGVGILSTPILSRPLKYSANEALSCATGSASTGFTVEFEHWQSQWHTTNRPSEILQQPGGAACAGRFRRRRVNPMATARVVRSVLAIPLVSHYPWRPIPTVSDIRRTEMQRDQGIASESAILVGVLCPRGRAKKAPWKSWRAWPKRRRPPWWAA